MAKEMLVGQETEATAEQTSSGEIVNLIKMQSSSVETQQRGTFRSEGRR